MAPQPEEAGSVSTAASPAANPTANPAPSVAGAGTYLKTTPNASVRAASIHNAELGDENDAENVSYRVYEQLGLNLGWKDNLERKELVHTILAMNTSEVDKYLVELENQGKFLTMTFTECLTGRLRAIVGSKESPRLNEPGSVKVLSLDGDEGVFMVDSPDSHFVVQNPKCISGSVKNGLYEQLYSFRFPTLSRIQIACRLSWLVQVTSRGFEASEVRGTITGAAHDDCSETFAFGNHPLAFVIRGFRHIDRAHNRLDLIECIQRLQDIEDKLQHQEPSSLGELTIDLNTLNTTISKLRTCVQYIKTSMDSILAVKKTYPQNNEVIFYIIRGNWEDLNPDIIFLQKVCEQRLLDVESVQQRINISLSVVYNLLAQKENEWNRNMARSQKTIAMLTMFFLPATFFAILFTLPLFNWDPSKGPVLTDKLWIYWTFTVPLTALLFLCYFLWVHVKQLIKYLRRKASVDRRFPFWHWGKNGKEEDLETGRVDVNDDREGKTKTG